MNRLRKIPPRDWATAVQAEINSAWESLVAAGSPSVAPSWITFATDPAKQFIKQVGIEQGVVETIEIAMSAFPSMSSLAVTLDEDEESGKQTIVIKIKVQSTLDQALNEYEAFIQAWMASPAWQAREHICLSYRIG